MFILFGNRRINLFSVKSYKPIEKSTFDKTYYKIEFTFLDNNKEELHFFEREDERDEFLKKLDENILNKET